MQATAAVAFPGASNCGCANIYYRLRAGYGTNYGDQNRLNPWPVPSGRLISELRDVSGTLWLADSHCVVASPPGIWPSNGGGANNLPATGNWAQSLRHNQGANVLFCDGHVKWQNPGSLGIYQFGVVVPARGM